MFRLIYRTTVLLTAEVPSNELLSVLGRKVAVITRASFDVSQVKLGIIIIFFLNIYVYVCVC